MIVDSSIPDAEEDFKAHQIGFGEKTKDARDFAAGIESCGIVAGGNYSFVIDFAQKGAE